jgi:hypothetical protein
VAEDRLSQDEVAAVLRRAAELDDEVARPGDDRVPVAAIEAAAAEVGLAPAAVRQAVAELRAGALPIADEPAACDPHVVVEAAVVPLEPVAAAAAVGRWLSAQTFHRHRGRDGAEVWRLREDIVAGLQRKLDFSASVRLKWVRQVIVRTVAVEGGTLVRMEATLAPLPVSAPGIGAAAGAVPGTAAFALVAEVASASAAATAVVAAGGAGLGALGGWLAGRSMRQSSRARVADELAAALDRLGSGIEERNALDRLRARARALPRGFRA